ncbi:transposase [Terrabacter sp. Soil810]|uniref:transposase n=1 Tax=Terrabacter sp. Soil810 TaxID=1736418 RepID=UPI0009E8B031
MAVAGLADPGRAAPDRTGPGAGPPACGSRLDAAGGVPASRVAGTDLGDVIVLDVDATLVTAHSEKDAAGATFKGGFGYHPLGVWCDNTREMLAAVLRPGNAGSNTSTDHIEVLTAAIRQVPAAHRRRVLVREDGAGASPGAARLAHPAGRQTRCPCGVIGRVRHHRGGPRGDHARAEERMAGRDRRRRRRP